MPRAEPCIAEELFADLAEVFLDRILDHIEGAVRGLAEYPELDSPMVRRSLIAQFGEGLRQIPVSAFLIVYRCDWRTDYVLALEHGPTVI